MKTKILAQKMRNRKVICAQELGECLIGTNGAVPARTYDRLKRKITLSANKGEYITMCTSEGLRDTFGGYPAYGYKETVKFE